MHDQTLNQLQPQFLPTGPACVAVGASPCPNNPAAYAIIQNLTTPVNNPFAGNCPAGTVPACTGPVLSGNVGTSRNVKAAQLLLPFPQLTMWPWPSPITAIPFIIPCR